MSLTLSIKYGQHPLFLLPDDTIEQLLRENNTLQALVLTIPDNLLPMTLNIKEVNAPLTGIWIKTLSLTIS